MEKDRTEITPGKYIRNRIEDLQKIYTFFGEEVQVEKFHEEQDEYEQALLKWDRDEILEELADRYIVLAQLAPLGAEDGDFYHAWKVGMFEVDFMVDCMQPLYKSDFISLVHEKIDRTLDRIKTGYYDDWLAQNPQPADQPPSELDQWLSSKPPDDQLGSEQDAHVAEDIPPVTPAQSQDENWLAQKPQPSEQTPAELNQ